MRILAGSLNRLVEGLSVAAGWLAGLLVLAMCLLVAYAVVMRYLHKAAVGIDELTGYALVGVAFLALGDVLKNGGHISAGLVVSRLSPRARNVLYGVGLAISLAYVVGLVWSARWLVQDSQQLRALSATLSVPLFIPQLFILVGLVVFGLQLLVALLTTLGLAPRKG